MLDTKIIENCLIIKLADNNMCKSKLAILFNRLKNNKRIKKILIDIRDVSVVDFEIVKFVKKLQVDFKDIPIGFFNVDFTNNILLNMFNIDKQNQIFMSLEDGLKNKNPLVKRRLKIVNG